MKRLIRKILVGEDKVSAYAQITVTDQIREKVYLENGKAAIDVSQHHWPLCIEPIVYGIWIEKDQQTLLPALKEEYTLRFTLPACDNHSKEKTTATATVTCIEKIEEKEGTLFLLRLKKSRLHHFNIIKTFLIYYRYYKKGEFPFSTFSSFVSAYSFPRVIRIISFRQDDYYNIFPMDLLGEIKPHNRFVFGLRHTNIALQKIIASGKIVVSEVPHQYKNVIYTLGNHHSSQPPSITTLPFTVINSTLFGFYIPEWVENYKEITIHRSIDLGSHMLLWGEITNREIIREQGHHLYLIHFLHYLCQKKRGVTYTRV